MIAAGKVETLNTGFTVMVPTREVDRLARVIATLWTIQGNARTKV
jgi:hypothetical protein